MNSRRILGLDYGEKRVGLALSDPLGITAQPLLQISRESDAQLINEIEQIIESHAVDQIIVGLPISLSGNDSPQTKRTRRFISKLRKRLNIKVDQWDERLSTEEADRALRDMEIPPSARKNRRDVVAAQIILQGYLDLKSNQLRT